MTTTYDKIATTTVSGSSVANVTFSSISGSYTDLVMISVHKNTGGAGNLKLQFNSDTGSNYSFTYVYGNGSSASSALSSNQDAIIFGQADSTQFLVNICNINNYSNSTTNKTTLSRSSDNGNTYSSTGAIVGLWRNTGAITNIKIFGDSNIAIGSTFTLYGIAREV